MAKVSLLAFNVAGRLIAVGEEEEGKAYRKGGGGEEVLMVVINGKVAIAAMPAAFGESSQVSIEKKVRK